MAKFLNYSRLSLSAFLITTTYLQGCTFSVPAPREESTALPVIADGPAINQSAFKKGELDSLIREGQLCLPSSNKKLQSLDHIASLQYSDCRYKDVMATTDQMLHIKPGVSNAYYWKSMACLRQNDFRKSLQYIDAANRAGKGRFAGLETDIKHQQYDYEHKESDPAKRWALACSALLFAANRQGLNTLTGCDPSLGHQAVQRASIIAWWQIYDRKGLLSVLRSLVEHGYSFAWQAQRDSIKDTLKLDAYTSDPKHSLQQRHALQLVDRYGSDFKDRGLLAWDYGRFICLCRWGAELGFISYDEAWSMMLPVAAKLQHLYGSWAQLGGEYLIGRDFWSHAQYEEGRSRNATILNWLLKTPASPWVQLPWDTDLKTKGDNATIYAAIQKVQDAKPPAQQ